MTTNPTNEEAPGVEPGAKTENSGDHMSKTSVTQEPRLSEEELWLGLVNIVCTEPNCKTYGNFHQAFGPDELVHRAFVRSGTGWEVEVTSDAETPEWTGTAFAHFDAAPVDPEMFTALADAVQEAKALAEVLREHDTATGPNERARYAALHPAGSVTDGGVR